MKLSELKTALTTMSDSIILLPDGNKVPSHFHVTELGKSSKHFIDCGGTERFEEKASLQLWTSIDLHHRLKAEKLIKIIDLSYFLFKDSDPEVEVEYQQDTIGRFGLELCDGQFQLTSLKTDCLASDQCGISVLKVKKALSEMTDSCCTPGGGCC